jgi:hypothetical protein
MPRGARLDAPGTLHHVMIRGIEQGSIFCDDQDRKAFLDRIGMLTKGSGTKIYAFALMTNHGGLAGRYSIYSVTKQTQSSW